MASETTKGKEASNSPQDYLPYTADIVIAGISGRYPEADSVGEFRDNLYNKVNMVTVDERRWEIGELG